MVNKKVVFTFSEGSLEYLNDDKKHSGSIGESVRRSLAVRKALQSQAEQGFSEIIVRNPDTGKERVMVAPYLS